jgi:hypothetical protein
MSRTPYWVTRTISSIPRDIDEDQLAALLLSITQAYMSKSGHGDNIRFLFSIVVTYCCSVGISPLATKLIFVEAASMLIDAADEKDIPESPHPMQ